jgi:hypothetical protein
MLEASELALFVGDSEYGFLERLCAREGLDVVA